MGILSDLKRVVFGAKAVAKSAAEKTVEASQEAGEAFIEKSGDLIEKVAAQMVAEKVVRIDRAEELVKEYTGTQGNR